MLKKRFAHTGQLAREMSFDSMWLRICEPYVGEQSSIDFLINRTFMRPRALIDYVNMCKAIAINKGHQRVTADDILQGTRVFSDDILQNIGFEIGDIHPDLENSVYFFIDQPSSMKIDDLVRLLKKKGVRAAQQQTLIDVFLWYGVLGIEGNDGHVHFIYDLNYNFRKLKQLIEQRRAAVRFHINPAFSYALALSAGALAPQSQLI